MNELSALLAARCILLEEMVPQRAIGTRETCARIASQARPGVGDVVGHTRDEIDAQKRAGDVW